MKVKHLAFYLLLFGFFCTLCYSCTKSINERIDGPPGDSTVAPPNDTAITPPNDTASLSIYVAGDTMINGYPYAAYWKNGLITQVPAQMSSWVTGIWQDSNDVYVTIRGSSYTNQFIYWKNGMGVPLVDPRSDGYSSQAITISGGDLYATGCAAEIKDVHPTAMYLKNLDQPVYLVANGVTIHHSYGQAIAIEGKNIHVVGHLDYKAVYWQNQNIVQLPVPVEFLDNLSIANSICLYNNDIYIAGTIKLGAPFTPYFESTAVYWKNNEIVILAKEEGTSANAIAIVDNDVYVVGAAYKSAGTQRAVYWKNGEMQYLAEHYSIANAIAVEGSDIYIAGDVNHHATYWKNGNPITLGKGHANAIFISKK